MSMKPEDYEEFQRQLALQTKLPDEKKTTKVDDDGVEYEWDEEKKAWFPKLSVDQIIQYQANYSASDDQANNNQNEEASSAGPASYMDPLTKTKYIWDKASNSWTPETCNYADNFKYTDPKSGFVYKWDAKSKSWQSDGQVIKDTGDGSGDGEEKTTYIHPETGLKYTWNTEEQVWKSDDGEILLPSTDWSNQESYTDPQSGKHFVWDKDTQSWKESNDQSKPKQKKKAKTVQKRPASKPEWFDVDKEKNTSVYVTGLPPDMTHEEFSALMGKCGIITPNPLTGEPKLKLYLDKIGNPKGDGLCSYLKRESVELAMQILDDMEIRKGYKLHIEEAEFQLKGNYDVTKKPKMLSKKEKKKLQKEQEKKLDWRLNRAEETLSKTDRVVILKNMFDPSEFEEDPVLITDIRDDLRKECEKFGAVKKVIVFDRHPDGVCSVAFKEIDAAIECQKALNGRWFAGKSVDAQIWDGATNYQMEETDKEREVRLKKWEQYLLDGGEKDDNPETSQEKDKTEDNIAMEEAADSKVGNVSEDKSLENATNVERIKTEESCDLEQTTADSKD
uniref:17S U2 SnRNP complex component HTATSF1 n=1 Tax=Phallusia mammillata TaxID=59560 RepID=A0A6F9DFR1_9ASCI|nr:HIV Tat-specific factor 1 homolog [Phallusia mammillata]